MKNYPIYAAKERELKTAIGEAVSWWANLEVQILDLFAISSGLSLKTAAAISQHFRAFSLLREVTSTAVLCKLADNGLSQDRWISLDALVRELSGDRNFLAHTPVVIHGQGHPNDADGVFATPFVGPAVAPLIAGSPQKMTPVSTSEAMEVVADIQHTIPLLMEFKTMLVELSPSNPKFAEPVSRRRPARKERQAKNQKQQ